MKNDWINSKISDFAHQCLFYRGVNPALNDIAIIQCQSYPFPPNTTQILDPLEFCLFAKRKKKIQSNSPASMTIEPSRSSSTFFPLWKDQLWKIMQPIHLTCCVSNITFGKHEIFGSFSRKVKLHQWSPTDFGCRHRPGPDIEDTPGHLIWLDSQWWATRINHDCLPLLK